MTMTRKAMVFGLVAGFAVLICSTVTPAHAQHGDPKAGAPSSRDMQVAPKPKLVWRVENPFRFFKDPDDTAQHREMYEDLLSKERATPVLSAERILNADPREGWAKDVYTKTCWDPKTNRHHCGTGDVYITPKSHAVIVTVDDLDDPDAECRWRMRPKATRKRRYKAKTRLGPCAGPMRFDIPYPTGAEVMVKAGGEEIARQTIKVRDILIAGVGDSFASGEGNPDVPVRFAAERAQSYGEVKGKFDFSGYPTRVGGWKKIGDETFNAQKAQWNDRACHRSLYSHQMRAALQISLEDPHRAVTFVGVSCSGAQVTFGMFLRYKGNEWVENPPDLSQISALAVAQCGRYPARDVDMPEAYHMRGVIKELQGGLVLKRCDRKRARKIDLLFVSISGNDIGFARLVANAVLADQSLLKKLGGWFGQLHEKEQTRELLSAVDERLKALNRAFHGILHIPWNQSDRIILTAYPPIALLGENLQVCPSGSAGMDVLEAFSLSRARALSSTLLANQLDSIMKKSARYHGWSFADAHRSDFVGRGICAGVNKGPYANADDLRLPRKVNGQWQPYNPAEYHPYQTRQRWFRTPNDAYLTGHLHATAGVLSTALSYNRFSWFQILLASTYSGAFHPTAEGQAVIADSLVQKARRVLKKRNQ